ncbi:MAG: penicillin acylase family protein [Acidobacteriota bacterium]
MRRVSLIVAVPVLLLVLVGAAWVFIQQSGRPIRDGERQIPGLQSDVDIRYDARGVPHIEASEDADLFRALGFVHANDRLTQMELGRRAAAGRLAELVGEPAFEFDVYFHTMRFPETAEALWRAASPRSKAALEAYAEGVNAFLGGLGALPPGLRLLGAELEPWRPQDSLAFSLLMARDLSFWNGRPEEERFAWLRAFGADGVRDLLGDADLHVPDALVELAGEPPEIARTSGIYGPGGESVLDRGFLVGALRGSNNWAIGPGRTVSGRPMIANDPHLPLFLPSVWYQAQLRSPGYEAAGMTLPGTPGVVLGRGPAVAWAFTNVMLDDHDLFFEQLDDTGTKVRRGDGWAEIERETVTVRLRGGDERTIEVRRTDRGPLLDADPERGLPARSVTWTAHTPGDPVAALLDVAAATTPEALVEATRPYVAPAQNLVAAFKTGELVYTMLGKTPERRLGDGRLPAPGWDLDYGWDGLRDHAEHPRDLAPADDLIVTANHAGAIPGDYALPLSGDFFGPSRADRIRGRLLELDVWGREPFAQLQMDTLSLHAGEVLELLAADGPFDGDAATAFTALESWDRRLESRGPSALWVLLERELIDAIWRDESQRAGLDPGVGHPSRLLPLLRGERSDRWIDDVTTDTRETRPDLVAGALGRAWREGVDRWGPDVRRWAYGELHALTLRHPLDEVPIYGRWTRRGPFAVGGSATTVMAFGAYWRQPDGAPEPELEILYGPSMRYLVDWADPDRSWAVLPGGQSGHPADPHYADQVAPFLTGELFEAPWSREAIEAATVSTLRLTP